MNKNRRGPDCWIAPAAGSAARGHTHARRELGTPRRGKHPTSSGTRRCVQVSAVPVEPPVQLHGATGSMEGGLEPALPPEIALRFLDALGVCQDQPAGRALRRAARLSDALQGDQAGETAQELVAALRRLELLSDDDEDDGRTSGEEQSQCDPPAVDVGEAGGEFDSDAPSKAGDSRYSRGRMSSWTRGGDVDETEGERSAPEEIYTRGRSASASMSQMGFQAVQGALREATRDDLRVVLNGTMRQLTASVTDGVEGDGGALPDTFTRADGRSKDQLRRWMAEWLHERLHSQSPLVKHKVLTTMTLLCERGPTTFLPKLRIRAGLRGEVDRLQSCSLPADPVHGDRPTELVREAATKLLHCMTHGNDFDFGPDLVYIRGPAGAPPLPGVATVGAAGFVFQAPRQGTLFELKVTLAKLLYVHLDPDEVILPANTPRLSEYAIEGRPMRSATIVFVPPGQKASETLVVIGSEETLAEGVVPVLRSRIDAYMERKATAASERGSILARMRSTASRRPSV